jgi:hypothetical protein
LIIAAPGAWTIGTFAAFKESTILNHHKKFLIDHIRSGRSHNRNTRGASMIHPEPLFAIPEAFE